jgi:hypothetical protein
MRLFDKSGFGYELTILGYQFPHLATEEYDSNWLNVQVDVVHPEGSWKATDAALLTYEAEHLADWLAGLAHTGSVSSDESFLEPCLSFKRIRDNDGGMLRTYFDLELRPQWKPAVGGAGNEDLFVEAPLADLGLTDAVAELRAQLARFPQRASR